MKLSRFLIATDKSIVFENPPMAKNVFTNFMYTHLFCEIFSQYVQFFYTLLKNDPRNVLQIFVGLV
jgi:hypothetical protein